MTTANHACWYRTTWEELWRVADDNEAEMLDNLAHRAERLWRCGDLSCSFSSPSDVDACEDCGTAKVPKHQKG